MACRRIDDFIGAWKLRRSIRHADGLQGHFDGTARFDAVSGGLRYSETGRLVLPGGAAVTAERRYFWDNDLNVYFDDGRFFHPVPPVGGAVTHQCAPDLYEGTYDFSDWPAFSVVWRVTGPRKDYVSKSNYRR